MVPVEVRQQPHVSFRQLDQYLRCPLRYRSLYIDLYRPRRARLRAGGAGVRTGIHAAAAVFFRGTVYSYAVGLSPFANGDDVRLGFDVLTKTKQPGLHRYWTTRDRAANVRLFRLVPEVLGAIEAAAFHPIVGWQCKECPFRTKCRALG
jgi:hypothetical protein